MALHLMVITPDKVTVWVCECVCVYVCVWDSSMYKKNQSLSLLWEGFQTPGNDWLKEDTFYQPLLTVENVEKVWRVTCISAHVLNQFEAQVMLWKSTSFDKHHAVASKRKSMMDGHSASEKAEKTKSKQEAALSLSLSLSDSLSVCFLGSEDWLWIVQNVWALRSYHGSQHGERMTDVVSVLCLFERRVCVSDGLDAFGGYKDDLSSLMCLFVFL